MNRGFSISTLRKKANEMSAFDAFVFLVKTSQEVDMMPNNEKVVKWIDGKTTRLWFKLNASEKSEIHDKFS